jgi:hypothetical protein
MLCVLDNQFERGETRAVGPLLELLFAPIDMPD